MSGIIRIEIPDLERTIRQVTSGLQHMPRECSAAIARAVNRTLDAVRAEAVRIGREKYTARAESLRKRAVIRRATRTSPVGVLELRGRKGMSLLHFRSQPGTIPNWKGVPVKQRQPRGGVSNLVKKGGRSKDIRQREQQTVSGKAERSGRRFCAATGNKQAGNALRPVPHSGPRRSGRPRTSPGQGP